jgi:hypothetical protein
MANGNAARDDSDRPSLSAVDDDDAQADDPVSAAMGGGGRAPLADDLEDLDEPAISEDEDYLPPEFDLFRIQDEVAERFLEKGKDPTCVKVMIHPVHRQKRAPAIKAVRPEGVTYAKLCEVLPPGRYDVVAYQENGKVVGSRRIRVSHDGVGTLSAEVGDIGELGGGGAAGPRGQTMGDKLLYMLAMDSLKGRRAQGNGTEIREMMQGMAAMTRMQMDMMAMELKQRMTLMDSQGKRESRESTGQMKMLTTILDLVDKRTPKGRTGGAGKFEDFVAAMQLGHHFASLQKGADNEGEELRKWVLPLVDSLGPGVIGAMAMFLPKEKAQMLSDLMEQHLKTRQAEASGDEGPDVVDAFGEEKTD